VSRLLARLQRDRLEQEHAELVREALLAGNVDRPSSARSAPADPFRLRGIPCIARGVSGALPGSQPEREALRRVRE
jgi:hypothetical protein